MTNRREKLKIAVIECGASDHLDHRRLARLKGELEPKILSNYSEALDDLYNNKHSVYLLNSLPEGNDPYQFFFKAKNQGCTSPIIFLVNDEIDERFGDVLKEDRPPIDYLKIRSIPNGKYQENIYRILENPLIKAAGTDSMSLRSIFESLSIMFYVENYVPLYHYEYLSPGFECLGYSLEELYADTDLLDRVLVADGYQRMMEKNEEISKGNKTETNYEYRVRAKDGEVRWWKDCGKPIFDENGKRIKWIGVIYDITDNTNTELALQNSERQYRDLVENAHDMIYSHDLAGNLQTINQAVKKISGYSVKEALKLNMAEFAVPEHRERVKRKIAQRIDGRNSKPYEIDVLGKKGRRISLEINSRLIYENDKPHRIDGIARDVTERNRLSRELDRFYDLSFDMLAAIDFEGNVLQVNPTWETTLGYSSNEILYHPIQNIIHPNDIKKLERFGQKIRESKSYSFELRLIHKNGEVRWFEWGTIPILEENIFYAVARDITDRKEGEKQLEYAALHDSLTGLPNRKNFMKHLDLAVERAKSESSFSYAVFFIDLDRFKVVNDSLGHIVGDKLLIAVSEMLKTCIRQSDVLARLGGDEFTVLVPLNDRSEAVVVAERIQQKLSDPFEVEGYQVFASASVGIVLSGDQKHNSDELLSYADTAMYRAKAMGKARYEFYDDEMHKLNVNLLKIETELRRAIENKEFRVYYQPIVDLCTGQVGEFEALIRWQHPERGLIYPDEFINVAEETGLIIPIGGWVIEEACRQIFEWEDKLNLSLKVSVNLAAKQIMHPLLVKNIEEILRTQNIKPEQLKLEVTESSVIANTDLALKTTKGLHKIGVGLSLDDFGTGYSSLSYLHLFPFQRIKIDRSFVGNMDSDIKSEAIVRSIMVLGQNLEIDIVAEGIENEIQLRQLRSLGCELGQGFLFAKALSAKDAERLLVNGLHFDFDEMESSAGFSSGVHANPSVHIKDIQ